MNNQANITNLSSKERDGAQEKYKIIAPYVNNSRSLKSISKESSIPLRTLTLWVKKFKSSGLVGLARKNRNDKGSPRKIDVNLIATIKALYLKHPESSRANIYRLLSPYCKKNNLSAPSYRSVCNIISFIPDDITLLSHKGSKAYKQKYDLLCIRDSDRPNQIWQADHVLMDIEIVNAKNKAERPWLTIIIDDCSRVICGYELSLLAPSAYKTSLCLRQAIWRKIDPDWHAFGVPEILYTDHGSDFTSKHIEQVCIALKIELMFSQIGQPRGRGKIERFFRTLNQKLISDLLLVNKKGHLLSLEQLDRFVLGFIKRYNQETHSELKMSPMDRWLKDGFIPNILDSLEHLDLLLFTETKPRLVRRDGIHFQGLRYLDTILAEYIGKEVIIRYMPSDVASIRVFYGGKYLCQPVCPELSNQTISIKEIQQARNKRRYQLKKEIKEQKSLIDAVVSSCRKDLEIDNPYTPDDMAIRANKIIEKSENKIKLYNNE
jgi:putative transposase